MADPATANPGSVRVRKTCRLTLTLTLPARGEGSDGREGQLQSHPSPASRSQRSFRVQNHPSPELSDHPRHTPEGELSL
eukprot:CAMPEP_0177721414 /NCGR_PEP_ID=MMETSP0484_2-20121128/17133_1 /TAXON_ID=354590 /ORGANISM="Rhodomonas lens, Strain RHODO" /LENGTH=78 /DNA_ID=CAMNT_0019233715 /DNA_START=530 /DNA_END=762 /DNA_ORIENTATION=+